MTIPWPIKEFSSATCGPGNKKIAMIVAYFDESGIHGDQSKVTSVAGLVSNSVEWSRLELPWKKRLGSIKCFHATDCEAKQKEFNHFDDIEKTKLSTDLAKLIAQRKIAAIGCSVYRDDWKYGASEKMKRDFRTPYHFCLTMALAQINIASHDFGGDEPVALVFAKQQEYQDYALAIHEVYGQGKAPGIGHMSFSEPKYVLQLQAADLYSYECYREHIRLVDDSGAGQPVRDQLQIIEKGLPHRRVHASISMLHQMADEMDRLKGDV